MSRYKELKQLRQDREGFISIYKSRLGDYDRLITELENTRDGSWIVRWFCPSLKHRIIQLTDERANVLHYVQRTFADFDKREETIRERYYFGVGGKFHKWFMQGVGVA